MAAKKREAAKEPVKPAKKAAARKPAAASARANKPAAEVKKTSGDLLRECFDEILCQYAEGFSLAECLKERLPAMAVLSARTAIYGDPELKKRWFAIKEHRARHQIELAGDIALVMSGNSLQRNDAAKLLVVLAEKTNPKEFGSKTTIEHTGADGGDIKQVIQLEPGEAYRRMLLGPKA